ncbi:hypothetical protein FIA58_009160 [Flavobacterium jejuense]|uniref:Uncharacterized protein n=1 Tax=Flavobacterium jejuense TaxID=1544455 RepID=A0ABX0IUT1_9FLAO|nr:hypothetical protein [Flavobacterium jejuense]NHN25841.1 hypothetical protein [Flavobacterium jejuense]
MPLVGVLTSAVGGSSVSAGASNLIDSANGTASLDPSAILGALDGFGLNVVGGLTNILANGLDLSCWNSSYNPTEAKKDIVADIPFALKWSGFEDNPNSETLQNLMKFIWAYKSDAISGQRLVKCSAKGHKMREEAIASLFISVMDLVYKGFEVKEVGFTSGELYIASGVPYARGGAFRWRYENMPIYEIKPKVSSGGSNINTGNSNIGSVSNSTGVTSGVNVNADNANVGSTDTTGSQTETVLNVAGSDIPIKVDPKESKPSGVGLGWLALLLLL